MWFVGYLGKVASAGSMARSARHLDLALATTKAVAMMCAARIFTGVRGFCCCFYCFYSIATATMMITVRRSAEFKAFYNRFYERGKASTVL